MIVTLHEPGEILRTIDAQRRHIQTFVVNEWGELVKYDDGLHQATTNTNSRLDFTESGQ